MSHRTPSLLVVWGCQCNVLLLICGGTKLLTVLFACLSSVGLLAGCIALTRDHVVTPAGTLIQGFVSGCLVAVGLMLWVMLLVVH